MQASNNNKTKYIHIYIYIYTYLELVCSLFWGLKFNPPKEGLLQSKQGLFGSRSLKVNQKTGILYTVDVQSSHFRLKGK